MDGQPLAEVFAAADLWNLNPYHGADGVTHIGISCLYQYMLEYWPDARGIDLRDYPNMGAGRGYRADGTWMGRKPTTRVFLLRNIGSNEQPVFGPPEQLAEYRSWDGRTDAALVDVDRDGALELLVRRDVDRLYALRLKVVETDAGEKAPASAAGHTGADERTRAPAAGHTGAGDYSGAHGSAKPGNGVAAGPATTAQPDGDTAARPALEAAHRAARGAGARLAPEPARTSPRDAASGAAADLPRLQATGEEWELPCSPLRRGYFETSLCCCDLDGDGEQEILITGTA